MSIRVFISYSHRDEGVLERLRVHLRMLEREGAIDAWDDREIQAGDEIDRTIAEAHDGSIVFLPIISPDFLASNYCYEREMTAAMEKAARGEMTIIPVIAQPCDWLSSPLKKFKAVPRDGKPISEWANPNNAYLDIVQQLRRFAQEGVRRSASPPDRDAVGSMPRIKIKKDFSSIDRGHFRDAAYQEIRRYFAASVDEFSQIDGLQGHFEDIDANAFTCTIVNRAKRDAESHLTVRNSKGNHALGDITCSFEAYAKPGSANEFITVDSDEYDQFLEFGMRGFNGREGEHRLSASQVADLLWKDFLHRAGIDYE